MSSLKIVLPQQITVDNGAESRSWLDVGSLNSEDGNSMLWKDTEMENQVLEILKHIDSKHCKA